MFFAGQRFFLRLRRTPPPPRPTSSTMLRAPNGTERGVPVLPIFRPYGTGWRVGHAIFYQYSVPNGTCRVETSPPAPLQRERGGLRRMSLPSSPLLWRGAGGEVSAVNKVSSLRERGKGGDNRVFYPHSLHIGAAQDNSYIDT
jgi:hypothetical protein